MKTNYSVTTSGEGIIPAGVTKIDDGAFEFCEELETIVIPESVTEIGAHAFEDCGSLKSVTVPESVTEIGERAFSGCGSLLGVSIPGGVSGIAEYTFSDCGSLENVTIGSGVKKIGDGAFFCCGSLKSITVPEGVTEIGEDAFKFCESLESIGIPGSVTGIGKDAFNNCPSLGKVAIPDEGLRALGAKAYNSCRLAALVFDDGTSEICSREFGESFTGSAKRQLRFLFPPKRISVGGRVFFYEDEDGDEDGSVCYEHRIFGAINADLLSPKEKEYTVDGDVRRRGPRLAVRFTPEKLMEALVNDVIKLPD